MPQFRANAPRHAPTARPRVLPSAGAAGAASAPMAKMHRAATRALSAKPGLFRKHLRDFKDRHANLSAVEQYDPGKQYLVQLKVAVQVQSTGQWLRPVDEVKMSGKLAATMADKISGAKAL